MRSARVPAAATPGGAAPLFTPLESTFRNAKLGTAALIVYKAAADVGAKGVLFVLTVLAARRLSPWAFGVFAVGTTIGWLLSVVTDFGVQLHVARAVARTPDAAPQLLRRWGRVRVLAAVLGIAAIALTLFLTAPGVKWALPVMLFALTYTAIGLLEFLNYFYRGLSRTDIESTLTLAQRTATLILGCAVLVWYPNLTALAIAMLLPAAAALAWSGWLAISVRPPALSSPVPEPESAPCPLPSSPSGQFFRDVFPIGIGIVLSAVYFRVDVLLVQWWAGTEAVARYNAVFRLVDALRLLPAAILAVMLPSLSRATDRAPFLRIAAAVTALAMVTAAAVWIGADHIVRLLYGAAYRSAVPAFRILALTFPLLSMNYALTHQLILWDRQHAYAVICGLALACNVAMNAWLIPAFSIEGAAWSTFATEVVLTSGCLLALRPRS